MAAIKSWGCSFQKFRNSANDLVVDEVASKLNSLKVVVNRDKEATEELMITEHTEFCLTNTWYALPGG